MSLRESVKADFRAYAHALGIRGPILFQNARILFGSRAFYPLLVHRLHARMRGICTGRLSFLQFPLAVIYQVARFLLVVFCKISILESARISPGVFLSNQGNIVLGARSVGPGGVIAENVTVGVGLQGVQPVLGANVTIGPGSVVFGAIEIGDDVVIEGNTILCKNIPGGFWVGGNPPRILRKRVGENG